MILNTYNTYPSEGPPLSSPQGPCIPRARFVQMIAPPEAAPSGSLWRGRERSEGKPSDADAHCGGALAMGRQPTVPPVAQPSAGHKELPGEPRLWHSCASDPVVASSPAPVRVCQVPASLAGWTEKGTEVLAAGSSAEGESAGKGCIVSGWKRSAEVCDSVTSRVTERNRHAIVTQTFCAPCMLACVHARLLVSAYGSEL